MAAGQNLGDTCKDLALDLCTRFRLFSTVPVPEGLPLTGTDMVTAASY